MVQKEKLQQLLLSILKENKDITISGVELAKKLNITRSYVNILITNLIEIGHTIETINRIGYRYKNSLKVVDLTKIINNTNKEIILLDTIDSTNTYLKNIAKDSLKNNIVVIANKQTAGRGRLGRSFVSNKTSGIYMSLLYRPSMSIKDALKITAISSVATSNAIDELINKKTKIKWVNDIYLDDYKICGILTEGATLVEENKMEYVIVGIGINLYHQEFDEELSKKASNIEDLTKIIIDKNDLIIKIINNIDKYLSMCSDDVMKEYIAKSNLINKNVILKLQDKELHVKVTNITKDGQLVINDGVNEQFISSGEVLRVIM